MRNMSNTIVNFSDGEEGTISVIMAVALLVMFGGLAAAIDVTYTAAVQNDVRHVSKAICGRAASAYYRGLSADDAETLSTDLGNELISTTSLNGKNSAFNVTIDDAAGKVSVSGRATVGTPFMAMFGVDSLLPQDTIQCNTITAAATPPPAPSPPPSSGGPCGMGGVGGGPSPLTSQFNNVLNGSNSSTTGFSSTNSGNNSSSSNGSGNSANASGGFTGGNGQTSGSTTTSSNGSNSLSCTTASNGNSSGTSFGFGTSGPGGSSSASSNVTLSSNGGASSGGGFGGGPNGGSGGGGGSYCVGPGC